MNIEPTGPYVYQPYAVATKHGAAGRLWAVSGLSALHPLASGELRGLTKEEAQRVVAALTAAPTGAGVPAEETEFCERCCKRAEAEIAGGHYFTLDAIGNPDAVCACGKKHGRFGPWQLLASRAVPTAPAATETNDG